MCNSNLGQCLPEMCADGEKNGDETDVDCSGDVILYFGEAYKAFASQEDPNTVEEHLFAALKTCLITDRASCAYDRSGRTEKGVNAFGQVVTLNAASHFRRSYLE